MCNVLSHTPQTNRDLDICLPRPSTQRELDLSDAPARFPGANKFHDSVAGKLLKFTSRCETSLESFNKRLTSGTANRRDLCLDAYVRGLLQS